MATLVPFLVLGAILAAGGCGGSDLKNATTTKPVVVTLSPASAMLVTSGSLQFTASVAGTQNEKVTWTASAGSITSSGVYTAPSQVPNPALVTVTATSVANTSYSAAAQVTIESGPNAISVTLSPASGTVAPFGTLQFTASVTGDANTAVTWYINGVQGGSQSSGYITSNGLFLSPSGVPTKASGNTTAATTAAITAVLNDNHAYSATANVVIQPQNQTAQSSPIELGTSGGNFNDTSTDSKVTYCCGGTLGALLTMGAKQYILSTAHTLARSGAANIGDTIVQPSLLDANCDTTRVTTVADLSGYFNLQSSQQPVIDGAIAEVVPGQVDTSGKILYLGASVGADNVPTAAPPHAGSGLATDSTLIGREVAKSGRTTGLTCSTVDSVAMSVSVEYVQNCDGTGTPTNVQFSGQVDIAGSSFSAQGDSGALVVSQDTADPVGLLFASSDSSSVANPIADVLNYFTGTAGASATVVGGPAHAVIGCTLPMAPSVASATTSAVSTVLVQNATKVRDTHLAELLTYKEVQSVGVDSSLDNSDEAAIVLFVAKNASLTDLPQQIEGIRTRIVGLTNAQQSGITPSQTETMELERSATVSSSAPTLSQAEFRRAQAVHTAHVTSLLKQSGIQGVGISPSLDSPGEASLMIFTIRGVPHDAVPASIDGVRTRVRESSRFRAIYGSGSRACHLPLKATGERTSPRTSVK